MPALDEVPLPAAFPLDSPRGTARPVDVPPPRRCSAACARCARSGWTGARPDSALGELPPIQLVDAPDELGALLELGLDADPVSPEEEEDEEPLSLATAVPARSPLDGRDSLWWGAPDPAPRRATGSP